MDENEQVFAKVSCEPLGMFTITNQRIIWQHNLRDKSSCQDIWLENLLQVRYVAAIGSPSLELRHRLPDGTEATDVVQFPFGLGKSLGFRLSSGYSPKQLGHLLNLMIETPNQDIEKQIDGLRRKAAKYRGAFWMAGILTLVQGLLNLIADNMLGRTDSIALIPDVGTKGSLFLILMFGSVLAMILVLLLAIHIAISAVLIYCIADESECEKQAMARWVVAGIVCAVLLQLVFWVRDRLVQESLASWLSWVIRIGVGLLAYYSVFKLPSLFRRDGGMEQPDAV